MKKSLIIAASAVLVFSPSSRASEGYVTPDVSRVVLHLDRLPIDHDQMRSIARTLVTLAKTKHDGSDKQLRLRAQLLVLAMRMDRNNHDAINLNRKLAGGGQVEPPKEGLRVDAQRRIGRVISSLSQAELHSEAHTLVLYLKDVLAGLNPKDPILKGHQMNDQRWLHVLGTNAPKVAKVKPPTEGGLTGDTATNEEKKDPAKNVAPEKKNLEWLKKEQRISYPVYIKHQNKNGEIHLLTLVDITLNVSASDDDESGPINLRCSPKLEGEKLKALAKELEKSLAKLWGEFPHANLAVKFPGEYSSKNGNGAFFPLMIESSAALTQQKIKQGVTVIGAVNWAGKVYKNHDFWKLLEPIRESEQYNRTLICPLDSQEALLQLVALEDAEFFIRNEVIGVDNVKDALKFSVKLEDSKLREAHELFVKIRDLVGSKSVGSFSVSRKIKTMLENIISLNPNHISAKMLLVRGDSKRSKYLSHAYFLEEFKPLMKSLKYVYGKPVDELSGDQLHDLSEDLKEKIDTIDKYVDYSDKKIIQAFQKMASELNNMSRSRKKIDSDFHQRSAENSHERFSSQFDIVKAAVASVKP